MLMEGREGPGGCHSDGGYMVESHGAVIVMEAKEEPWGCCCGGRKSHRAYE